MLFATHEKSGPLTRFFYCHERKGCAHVGMLTDKEQSLLDALEVPAKDREVEIVTVEVVGSRKSPTIRVYIDTPQGVTFNELTQAQEWISDLLDKIDPFPGAYLLEVSSPGIDRPLRTPAHFCAAVGQEARVKCVTGIDGRKSFKGIIKDAGSESITLATEDADITIVYDDVKKANIIGAIEF